MASCASIGPASVPRDRFDYIGSISESSKRQLLLNLLKERYADAPVFLDVTSVTNAYTLEGAVELLGQNSFGEQLRSVTANAHYADQPTITYTPLAGDKFAKSIMSPIPLSGLLLLIQGGHRVDGVFRLCVKSINGLHNAYGGDAARPGDAGFRELIELLREDQTVGGLEFQVRSPDAQEILLSFAPTPDAATLERHARIATLLGLKPGKSNYRLTFAPFASNDTEIAVQSRSMQQVLVDLASYIEVPQEDVAEGRVYAPMRSEEQQRLFPAPLRVRYGDVPTDAYISVRYRGRSFWIDDRDRESKAAFTFVMTMFSLVDTETPHGPVLTIPAR